MYTPEENLDKLSMNTTAHIALHRVVLRVIIVCALAVAVIMMVTLTAAPLLPHAGQIVYNARAGGVQALYLLDTERLLRHPLVRQDAGSYLPSWSADGAQLAYIAPPATEGDVATIARIYPARNLLEPLFRPHPQPGVIRGEAIWSPSANDLVFTYAHLPGDAPGSSELQLIQLDLQSGTVASMPMYPEFAPLTTSYLRLDERWLRSVAVSARYVVLRDFDLRTFETPSRRLQIWEVDFVSLLPPALSPDGLHFLVPAVSSQMRSFDLYLFTIGQAAFTNLTNDVRSNETQPTWSPDGKQIAYKMLTGAGQMLVVSTIDGGDTRVLFRHSTARIADLRWSPDASRIAFLVTMPGQYELCIVTLADGMIECPVSAERIAETAWRPSS